MGAQPVRKKPAGKKQAILRVNSLHKTHKKDFAPRLEEDQPNRVCTGRKLFLPGG